MPGKKSLRTSGLE